MIIVVLLIAGFDGFSQDSLKYYMDIVVKENPQILQKYYEYEASLQKIPQAAALSDPELNAGIFLTPMELVMGNQVAEFQLMQMFPWFGTLRAARDEMSLMANAAYESFRDTKLQVLFELQSTWYELIKIDQEKLIALQNLEILYSIERLARVRFTTGTTKGSSIMPADRNAENMESSGPPAMQGMQSSSPNSTVNTQSSRSSGAQESPMGSTVSGGLADIYNIQIEISDIKNNVAILENRKKSVTAQFNAFFNRPALNPVFLPDKLVADTSYNLDSAKPDSFIMNNPMLAMQNYETQSILARKKMVARMGFPMLGIGVNYSIINKSEMVVSDMNGRDMIMPMMSLTLPIYRKKYKAMRTEADLLSKASEKKTQKVYNDLNSQYYLAIQQYDDALRRIRLYSNQASLTRKSLNIMTGDFSTSGTGLSDIMRLQQKLLDYDYRHIEAITDFYIAVALLKRISGI